MKTSEILIKAKELIANPVYWTQGDYEKKNVDGTQCYCSLGAIGQVLFKYPNIGVTEYGEVSVTQAAELLKAAVGREVHKHETFAPYNDSHTHSEVMEAFDKAIHLAKAKE
jgi:hypothetical protein